MKVDELQALLARYGLSEAEVRAFYHLAKLGEATATELAKEAGLSRAEVYRAADGLEARGLIERTVDRPQRFVPRRIQQAIEMLLAEERARVGELEANQADLVANWPRPEGPEEAEDERFQVQKGRTQIEGALRRMLSRAVREVVFIAPHRTVNRLLTWGVGDDLRQTVKRGVHVRILTQLTPDLLGEDSGLPAECELRHSEVPSYAQFVIVDQKEIAIYATVDPVVGSTGRPETVLWLNAPDFVLGQQSLFDDLWMQSVGPEARRIELETSRRPNQLRVVRGRYPRIDEMRSFIGRATDEVLFAVPDPAGDLSRLRVTAALKRAASKGVQVRVLAEEPFADLDGVGGVQQRRGAIDPRLGLVLVDDHEGLLVPIGKTDGPGEERSLVVSVPVAVALMRERFEAAWG